MLPKSRFPLHRPLPSLGRLVRNCYSRGLYRSLQPGPYTPQMQIFTFSLDENLFHISYEAGILEDPNTTPPVDMWKLTASPESAPTEPERISIEFKGGLPTKVTVGPKTYTDAVDIFLTLNALARKHGIGRLDIVENRFIGVKSRGCYESPAATILRVAHMDIEGLTLDRNVRALRDQFVTVQLSQILYNGYFFSPEREFVTSAIPASQRTVNGTVRLKLYKGNVVVEGRFSDEVRPRLRNSISCLIRVCDRLFTLQGLYDERESSMDELGGFEPTDTTGFIQIESIRIKKWVLYFLLFHSPVARCVFPTKLLSVLSLSPTSHADFSADGAKLMYARAKVECSPRTSTAHVSDYIKRRERAREADRA